MGEWLVMGSGPAESREVREGVDDPGAARAAVLAGLVGAEGVDYSVLVETNWGQPPAEGTARLVWPLAWEHGYADGGSGRGVRLFPLVYYNLDPALEWTETPAGDLEDIRQDLRAALAASAGGSGLTAEGLAALRVDLDACGSALALAQAGYAAVFTAQDEDGWYFAIPTWELAGPADNVELARDVANALAAMGPAPGEGLAPAPGSGEGPVVWAGYGDPCLCGERYAGQCGGRWGCELDAPAEALAGASGGELDAPADGGPMGAAGVDAPWGVGDHRGGWAIVDASGRRIASLAWGPASASMKVGYEQGRANLALMVAAPELYAALAELVADVEAAGVTEVSHEWPDLMATYRRAGAALAAARGEREQGPGGAGGQP